MEVVIVAGFIMLFLVIMIFSFFFSKDARTKRALASKERASIKDVEEGHEVKIAGRLAYAEEPLIAPLSGRPCACWEVVVEEYKSSGKSGSWREIIRDQECLTFFIEDDSGKALVVDQVPRVAIDKDSHHRSGTFNDATEELSAFLHEHGHESVGMFGFNRRMRYKEGVLEEGEEVAVMGLARREADPSGSGRSGGYREAPTIVIIDAPEGGQCLISDSFSTLR